MTNSNECQVQYFDATWNGWRGLREGGAERERWPARAAKLKARELSGSGSRLLAKTRVLLDGVTVAEYRQGRKVK